VEEEFDIGIVVQYEVLQERRVISDLKPTFGDDCFHLKTTSRSILETNYNPMTSKDLRYLALPNFLGHYFFALV
jgi:hypothetical protein